VLSTRILGLSLSAVLLAACQSTQVLQTEDALTAAGFSVRIADTAERQEMLNRLPANQFVQRVQGNIVHLFMRTRGFAAAFISELSKISINTLPISSWISSNHSA
jgi:hypothetical protein